MNNFRKDPTNKLKVERFLFNYNSKEMNLFFYLFQQKNNKLLKLIKFNVREIKYQQFIAKKNFISFTI